MASDIDEPGGVRWRELASQHLPCFREIIASASSHGDLWQSFKEFLSEAGTSESRKAEVESLFRYAWWCFAESGDEWLAAWVKGYFYEDLAWFTDLSCQVPRYVPFGTT
jgi:hypothetical protein